MDEYASHDHFSRSPIATCEASSRRGSVGKTSTRVPTGQSVLLHTARQANTAASTLFLVPGAQHGFSSAEEAVATPIVDAFLSGLLR